MEINEAGLGIIKYYERNPRTNTFYDRAYQDDEGVWTIGWGTIRWNMNTPVKKGDTITAEEADRQLLIELQRIKDAIDTSIKVKLNSNQYSALCSLFYNIGTGWCTGRGHIQATFIRNLNSGNYKDVASGIMRFTRGAITGKVYNGLIDRRKREAQLWLTPDDVAQQKSESDDIETMPQAVTLDSKTTTLAATEAVKESHSLWSGVAILLSTVWAFFNEVWQWVFGVAKEASTQAVSAKDAVSGLDPMISYFGMNMKGILAAITIAAAMLVIARAISRRK